MVATQSRLVAEAPSDSVPGRSRRILIGLAVGLVAILLALMSAMDLARPKPKGGIDEFGGQSLRRTMVGYDWQRRQIDVVFMLGNHGGRSFDVVELTIPEALGPVLAFEAEPVQGPIRGWSIPGERPSAQPFALTLDAGESAVVHLWIAPDDCPAALAGAFGIELRVEHTWGPSLGGNDIALAELTDRVDPRTASGLDEMRVGGLSPCEAYTAARSS